MSDISILQEIEAAHGKVTADLVVEAARDPEHPWHDRIDWDDETASHRWRQMQARMLIRSVRYERRDPDALPREQSYVSMATLLTDEDRARGALLAEFARVASALKRAREVADALSLGGEVGAMLNEIEDLSLMLRRPLAAPALAQ
jgi:hypothetical protein